MTAPRLTIGKGMGRRVTKAGRAAEARFDALVTEHLTRIGAAPPADGDAMKRWIVQTIHGRLRVSPNGNSILQSFMDWPEAYYDCIAYAKVRGFDHWKWNFHYTLTAEPDVADWKVALGKILPAAPAVASAPATPAPAAPIDYRLKYEEAVRHNEELQRQIERAFDYGLRRHANAIDAARPDAVRDAILDIRERFRRAAG